MNILFIGAINRKNLPIGGEEYKNQLLVKHFEKFHTLNLIDTHQWRKRPVILLRLWWQLYFKSYDRVLISASSISAYRLVKLISWNDYLSSITVYFVIGGYFPQGIKEKVFKVRSYNSLRRIVVQGDKMKQDLIQYGVKTSIEVLPNFKDFPEIEKKKMKQSTIVRFVFLSRVHPDKGISDIVNAVKILKQRGVDNFDVTFYGPVEQSYTEHFQTLLSDKLHYGGILDLMDDSKKAYETLSSYDVMLFPTYWKGEGFPGVIIDAFVAGLPIIATDWNMNREVLVDDEDSIIIPVKNPGSLAEAMYRFIVDVNLIRGMGNNSMTKAKYFHVDSLADRINYIVES